jgi:acetyl esterase/lipase
MPEVSARPMIPLDDAAIDEARRLNRKLAWIPRLRIKRRIGPVLIQALLRASQLGADRRLRRGGVTLELRQAEAEGLRVPVRILRPVGPPRGVVLDIHGGGWAMGNARMDDVLNAAMVRDCGVVVVSVDYRLAVSTPVQGLMDDCLAAARWLLEGGLPDCADLPVVVVGESAGGHLAATTLLRLKAWPALLRKVTGALLYYGVYDLAGTPSAHQAGPETLVLDGPTLPAALRLLTPGLSDAERRQPPLSPLFGDLRGMPPALLVTGTLDPLRDDTLELARRWREAGAEAELALLPESPHAFIHFSTRLAEATLQHARRWITARLQPADAAGLRPPPASAAPGRAPPARRAR